MSQARIFNSLSLRFGKRVKEYGGSREAAH